MTTSVTQLVGMQCEMRRRVKPDVMMEEARGATDWVLTTAGTWPGTKG